ncbi:MAG: hypothetical protein H0S80_07675 [Desulfovibrionaceae bacterium]|nr:hypothetical protein [Desulfovibrionaceae bacterium]
MTALEREDLQSLLVRIDERVKAIQEDIREINGARQCAGHAVKIRSLERLAWGCLAGLAAMGVNMLVGAFR